MSNSIAPVIIYLPKVIDKINKESAMSGFLDISSGEVKVGLDNSNEVKIRKWSFGGLGKYDGSIASNVGAVATWETQKLLVKRSTLLPLEIIEGIEGQAVLAEMVGEFQRTKVVPERDAVVFAKAYTNADASTTATPTTLTSSTVKAAIDVAIEILNGKEAPKEGRRLLVSNAVFTFMKNTNFFTYNLNAEVKGKIDTRFAEYDGMIVMEVPASRFNTEVTLSDTDGFALTGQDINFMIICKGAVQVITKITKGEVVRSAQNAASFNDTFKYLTYYDAITWDNQAINIYAHAKAA
jgi:hypothetical protein